MSSQHIELVGSESRMAGKWRSAVDDLRRTVETLDRLSDMVEQVVSGGDYAALSDAFGWASSEANTAKALACYNLLVGAKAAVDVAAVAQFCDRLG